MNSLSRLSSRRRRSSATIYSEDIPQKIINRKFVSENNFSFEKALPNDVEKNLKTISHIVREPRARSYSLGIRRKSIENDSSLLLSSRQPKEQNTLSGLLKMRKSHFKRFKRQEFYLGNLLDGSQGPQHEIVLQGQQKAGGIKSGPTVEFLSVLNLNNQIQNHHRKRQLPIKLQAKSHSIKNTRQPSYQFIKSQEPTGNFEIDGHLQRNFQSQQILGKQMKTTIYSRRLQKPRVPIEVFKSIDSSSATEGSLKEVTQKLANESRNINVKQTVKNCKKKHSNVNRKKSLDYIVKDINSTDLQPWQNDSCWNENPPIFIR